MAQAILVQEQALATLQSRVQELEQAAAAPAAGGGFLGGLFGAPQPAPRRPAARRPQGPIPQQYLQPGQGAPPARPGARPAGGGFLAGAMQTALGVAGGMMIANAITSAFESGTARRRSRPRRMRPRTSRQMDMVRRTTRRSTISAATPAASTSTI